jgi:hypothetical protein
MRISLSLLVAVAVTLPHRSAAQEFRLIASGRPAAVSPHEFTQISQIFELRDGRVVVLDRLLGEVRIADLSSGSNVLVGRVGDGPREYRQPLKLIPLGGDSVGVYDEGNVRVLVITATGAVGGFVSPFSSADGTRIGGLYGDGRGFIYGEQRARSSDDSASLFRWPIGSPNATFVRRIHRPAPEGAVSLGSGLVQPGSFARPGTRNTWAVASNGTLAISQFNPYQVILTSTSGRQVVGPVIPYERVPVNDSVKRAFLAGRPKAVTGVIVDPKSGRKTTVTEPVLPRDPATVTWAKEVPPFRDDAFVAFSPDGLLWIQRTTFHREGSRYDIIGPAGTLVDRVALPEGHRIIGFGRNAMYLVRRDADDLEFLQRWPFPNR